MKKIVSLLLAVMMVMSMMTFTAMASSDTLVVVTTVEDSLATGNLATSGNQGYSTAAAGNVVVVEDDADATNKIFNIVKTTGASDGNSGVLALRVSGAAAQDKSFFTSPVNRFVADVKLPSTTGIADLFIPRNAWSTAAGVSETFGVKLTNGGAYYYDQANETHVPFIEDNTLSANEWYHVEAIMDNRETPLDGYKTYMNAFVYDATGTLVGTSGWKYVSDDKPYSTAAGNYSFLGVQIQARGYSEGEVVAVDNFNAYKVSELPTYTIDGSVVESGPENKYASTASSGNYRSIADMFNGGQYGTVIQPAEGDVSGTANQAARIEMDVRIPKIANKDIINLFAHHSGNAGFEVPAIYTDGKAQFEGAAHLEGNTLTIRSYDSASAVYANTVATATLNANEWYTFVFDSEYSDNTAPTASLTVKDSNGNVVAAASNFAAQPIPKSVQYGQWISVMCLVGSAYKNTTIHVDNINYYAATNMAGLSDAATRTVVSEEDFDDMELGAKIIDHFKTKHNKGTLPQWETAAVVAEDVFVWEEGMVLESTDPLTLTFTYSNPVPVANITTNNIEFYADDVKMTSGYTLIPGEVDDNNCTTTFTISTNALNWGSDYIIRIKAEVADYNTALSGGVHAHSGLYKDISFSVAKLVPDFDYEAYIFDANDMPYGAATLTKGDVINGNVSIVNNEDGPITCHAILAIYDGNKLADIKTSGLITVPAGETVVKDTAEYTADKDGLTAKLFVWNNFETMRPWIAPVILGQ